MKFLIGSWPGDRVVEKCWKYLKHTASDDTSSLPDPDHFAEIYSPLIFFVGCFDAVESLEVGSEIGKCERVAHPVDIKLELLLMLVCLLSVDMKSPFSSTYLTSHECFGDTWDWHTEIDSRLNCPSSGSF